MKNRNDLSQVLHGIINNDNVVNDKVMKIRKL